MAEDPGAGDANPPAAGPGRPSDRADRAPPGRPSPPLGMLLEAPLATCHVLEAWALGPGERRRMRPVAAALARPLAGYVIRNKTGEPILGSSLGWPCQAAAIAAADSSASAQIHDRFIARSYPSFDRVGGGSRSGISPRRVPSR